MCLEKDVKNERVYNGRISEGKVVLNLTAVKMYSLNVLNYNSLLFVG